MSGRTLWVSVCLVLLLPFSVAADGKPASQGEKPPQLEATQSAALLVDADGSADVSPGDLLGYTVTVRNAGKNSVENAVFEGAPGAGTVLRVGSVATSQGTVVSGNAGGETVVAVVVGRLGRGKTATVTYEVEVEGALPPGLDRILNQGVVVADHLPAVLTDDPATPQAADPTALAVGTRPALDAVKAAREDDEDEDDDGKALDGEKGDEDERDRLVYDVTVSNPGTAPSTDVVFTDAPGEHLELVPGSVTASQGTVVSGNAPGDAAVAVEAGEVAPGEAVAISFEALVDDHLPSSVSAVANQGRVTSAEDPSGQPTDDPATLAVDDATLTARAGRALLAAAKVDTLLVDADGDGRAGPGDVLRYVVVIANHGRKQAKDVVFTDTPGLYTTLVEGTVATSSGEVLSGNAPGDRTVTVDLGKIKKRDSATVTFAVAIDAPLPDVAGVANQGRVKADKLEEIPTDDPATPVPDDPTVTDLPVAEATASVAGRVWHDHDADGVQDAGEPGLPGVTVTLVDGAGAAVTGTVTDGDGGYSFADLDAGDYAVEVTAPDGYTFSPLDQGGDDALDSDVDPATGRSATVTVAAGDDVVLDGGLYLPAAIAGFAWNDLDGDGVQAPAEPGLVHQEVTLLDAAGLALATAYTDLDGRYRFDGLAPGGYAVAFAPLQGFTFSPRDQGGDDARDSDADPADGRTALLILASGDASAHVDAGLFQPVTGLTSSPADGETGVAVTRETILRFSNALAVTAVVNAGNLYAEFGGQRLGTRIHLAPDRRTVSLFYTSPLPASARVRVTFVGDGVPNRFGNDVDADGDGVPGGTATIDFDTLSLTVLPDTSVCGRVFASELVPGDGGTSLNTPLAGVTITVDGKEGTLRAVTDGLGDFCLDPAPAGRFFVHVNGHTATIGVPPGAYYPVVGKAWESVPGRQVNIGEIYLPLVTAGTLVPVSQTADTTVHFSPTVLGDFPEFSDVQITVPADSLFADNGTRGGMVGIAPVPPDRLPGGLPEGLEFPVVITVQTDGASNFDVPVPACFPNLPDPVTGAPLAPGEKNALFSFNHDTGAWEHVGPMTVTADGTLICTDPGVGIRAPGWHGSGPPPTQPPPPPPPEKPPGPCPPTVPDCSEKFNDYINHCLVEYRLIVAGDVAVQAVELAACLATGPLSVGCVGHILAWSAAVKLASHLWYEECLANADLWLQICLKGTQNPRPPGCLAASLSPPGLLPVANLQDPEDDPVVMVFRQMEALVEPYLGSGGIVPPEVVSQVDGLLAQADALAGGSTTDYFHDQQLAIEPLAQPFDAVSGPVPGNAFPARGNAPHYPILFVADIIRPAGTLELRGQTGPDGQYTLFVPRDGMLQTVAFYDPLTKSYGLRVPRKTAGLRYQMPRLHLIPVDDSFLDSDGDGLADAVEDVYGTDRFDPDTDNDGIPDGAEVDQGTNPLDGFPTRTGIIATADTPGTAIDVCAVNDVAVVADSGAGVTVFNVFNGMKPVAVAQVDTPGAARAVACAGRLIAVADDTAGLAVVDVNDPPAALIVHQVDLGAAARAVTVAGNVTYVGLASGKVAAVDMASGTILDEVTIGGAVQDVLVAGDTLYALTVGTVYALPLRANLAVASSVASPGAVGAGLRRLRLFAGGGVLYATHTSGYNTFDITDPEHPVLIKAGTTPQRGWKQIVANGSGLGVAAVSPNSTNDGPHHVSLYDVSDPTETNAFLTQFETPGLAAAVSIFNGLAYVADSLAGLQVVNYLPYDALGVAPTLAVTTNFAPGVAEEGQQLRVTAHVTDDVQVRNVEFYVDGVRVLTDGNFPFEVRFVTPLLADRPSFVLAACATDTGGNRTCTGDLPIVLTPDATSPQVVATTPANGAGVAQGTTSTVSATFSEPVDLAILDDTTFRLFAAGPDEVVGTPDDVPVGATFSFSGDFDTAFLTTAAPLPPDLYRGVVSGSVTDLAGNPLPGDFAWTFRVRGPLQWINPAGGDWNDAANWSLGTVPAPGDLVRITLPGSYTVTFSGTATVGSVLVGAGPTLWIRGASSGGHTTLTVTGDVVNHGTLRLESQNTSFSSNLTVGGALTNLGTVEVNQGTSGARVIAAASLLNAGLLDVNFTLGLARANGVYLNEGTVDVAGGQKLTMTGLAQVFNMNGGDLAGAGTFEIRDARLNVNAGTFSGAPPLLVNSTLEVSPAADAPATFHVTGSGSRVRGTTTAGQLVWVQGSSTGSHTTVDVAGFVNGGTLRLQSLNTSFESSVAGAFTNAPGGLVEVLQGTAGARRLAGDFTNQGTLQVSFGLAGSGTWTNTGIVEVATGQKLTIAGAAQTLNHDAGEIRGPGVVELSAGAALNHNGGTVTGSPPLLINSALSLAASGTASFTVTGSGSMVSGTVAPAQTLWVSGRSAGSHTTVTLADGFVNAGTMRLESQNTSFESSVAAAGSFTNAADGVVNVETGTAGQRRLLGTFANAGTLNVGFTLAGAGTWTNTGTVAVAAGQKLTMNGAGQVFNHDGGDVAGTGVVELSAGAAFHHHAGTTSGSPPLLINSALELAATDPASFTVTGSLSTVSGTVAPGQTLWVSGRSAGSHTTVTLADGFVNAGTLRLESQNTSFESSLAAAGSFTNAAGGTIDVKTGTAGARRIAGAFANAGTLNADFNLTGAGTWTNTGTVNVATGQKLAMNGAAQVWNHDGGTIGGDGLLELSAGATFNFNGGGTSGNPPLLISSTLNIGPAATSPATFVLTGTGAVAGDVAAGQTVWVSGRSAGSHANVTAAAGFTNAGTLRLESQNTSFSSNLTVASGVLVNTGVIEVNTGTAGQRLLAAELDNQGTLRVNETMTLGKAGAAHTNTGLVSVAAGKTLGVSGASLTNAAGGVIEGRGTVSVGAVPFANGGAVNPGTSPGVLTVTGGLAQTAAGVVNVELGGTTAGSQFDRLSVSGQAALDGTLAVTLIDGFSPSLGQSFLVVGYGSRSGAFATLDGLDLGGGLRLDPVYGATGLTLTVVPSP